MRICYLKVLKNPVLLGLFVLLLSMVIGGIWYWLGKVLFSTEMTAPVAALLLAIWYIATSYVAAFHEEIPRRLRFYSAITLVSCHIGVLLLFLFGVGHLSGIVIDRSLDPSPSASSFVMALLFLMTELCVGAGCYYLMGAFSRWVLKSQRKHEAGCR